MKRFTVLATAGVLLLGSASAIGATYHVDSLAGNDAWRGTQPAPVAGDGPWQSLARVRQAQLQPGDIVRLKCGQIWREPLMVATSGTTAAPITVAESDPGCGNRPVVDGSLRIPSSQWKLYAGAIYVAKLPIGLVANGTFAAGIAGWRTWAPLADSVLASGTGCPTADGCLRLTSGAGTGASLATSPTFALQNAPHTLTFRLNAPLGVNVRVVVRRDTSPWNSLGLDQSVTGTGTWQTYTLQVRAVGDIDRARVDFELPPQRTMLVDEVSLSPVMGAPLRLHAAGMNLVTARHPNPGFDARSPLSPYALNAQDSDTVTVGAKSGSTFVTVGSDLSLPAGATLTPGLRIVTRTNAWMIDERTVAGVSGNRLTLDSPSSYPLRAGWGYLLTGALWMLDRPGEWHYDAANQMVYVWMVDGAHPGSRVSVAHVDIGIDLAGRTGVNVEGIAVRRTRIGVNLRNAADVSIRRAVISETIDEGVDAAASTNAAIEDSSLLRTGRDAILGIPRDGSSGGSVNLRVVRNLVSNSGVVVENGAITSIPIRSQGAIHGAAGSYIAENTISFTGYNGIRSGSNSQILANVVDYACLVTDDCGGIYLRGSGNNGIVTGNLVRAMVGSVHGKPSNYTQAQGIYLDDLSSGVTVSGNIVVDADNGIQVHNAYSNWIENNTLYGNRRYQLWLQADTQKVSSEGDVFANSIRANTLVAPGSEPALHQQSSVGGTTGFAAYDLNRYAALVGPVIGLESGTSGVQTYTFPQWQSATAAGVPRNLDPAGTQVTLGANAAYRVTGPNLVVNGDFAAGMAAWASWSPSAINFHQVVACAMAACATVQAGSAQSLLHSSNFSVVKDSWYRVSFDLRTAVEGQATVVGIRRGGGGSNGYEWLTTAPQTVSGSTAWKRHAFTVKVNKSVNVNDPVTLDAGARLDFQLAPGQRVWVDNVEIVPLAPAGSSLRTNIVTNGSRDSINAACPDAATEPAFCDKYVRFSDGAPITWPYPVPPLGAEVIYSRGDTLVDTDADGIGDIQDLCPGTAAGSAVDSRGCALVQVPAS